MFWNEYTTELRNLINELNGTELTVLEKQV